MAELKHKELLLAKDVAASWHVGPDIVRNLTLAGLLRGMKFGKVTKYTEQEVTDFEAWACGKDISDPYNVRDALTGEPVPHRFAGVREVAI